MSTVTFRQGVSGYTGTIDTRIRQAAPTTTLGTATTIGVDTGTNAEEQALLAFAGLFGSGPGQIPIGATITSATLTLQTTNGSAQGGSLYRMLSNWNASSTWSSLGSGVQFDGSEAVKDADLVTGAVTTGSRAFDVTTSLQEWAAAGDPNAANHGWVFKAGSTDGWDFYSSEGTTKPLLTVTYTTTPPPSLPVVSISGGTPDPQVEGPNKSISFTLSLNQAASQDVTVNYATLDGTATGGSDFTAIANGSITFAPGETSKTITVDLIDDTVVESQTPEDFTLKITSASNATVSTTSNTATGHIADNDTPPPLPVVSIGAGTPDPQVEGPNKSISFTLSLNQAASQDVTVNYATLDGTATGGSDFTAIANGSITFAPGETSKTITVDLIDDTVVESQTPEDFTLKITSASNATVSTTSNTATGHIADNDTPPPLPVVSIGAGTPDPQVEGPNKSISFTLSLNQAASQDVTVNYATLDGTATGGSDFTAIANGSITFAPGETSKTITVDLIDDTVVESQTPEDFTLKITSASNATVSTTSNTATGHIADNDTPPPLPVVSIGAGTPDPQVETAGAKISFALTLSEAATQNVTVSYSTVNGTATAGSDFTGLSNKTVTFLAGETSKTITVSLLNDTVVENPEAFTVKINSATNATVSTTKNIGTGNIVDNDLPATVVGTYDTTLFKAGDPSGYGSGDPSGLAYVPGHDGQPGTLFIADSEHDESPYFSTVNLLGLNADGSFNFQGTGDTSFSWHSITGLTKEPTGLAYNPANGLLYISDDNRQKIFWVDPANPSTKLGEFSTGTLGLTDTEDPKFDPQTGHLFMLDGSQRKLYETTATGTLVSSVALPSVIKDAEALAYSHTNADGHAVFFVAGGVSPTIYQVDDTGRLLAATDVLVGRTNPVTGVKVAPKGMELAPSSDPSDGSTMSLYVADYGADQKNDGRLFEIDLSAGWFVV